MFYGQSVTQTYPKERRNASVNSSAGINQPPAQGLGLSPVEASPAPWDMAIGIWVRFLLKGVLLTGLGRRIVPSAGFLLSVFLQSRKNNFPSLLCLRQLAAGFDHCQQHHTLSLDTSKGGTLVNPELAFCPSSKLLSQSSVLRNEE